MSCVHVCVCVCVCGNTLGVHYYTVKVWDVIEKDFKSVLQLPSVMKSVWKVYEGLWLGFFKM